MLENYWQLETWVGCTGIALIRRNSRHSIEMLHKNMLSLHVSINWEQDVPIHESSGNDLLQKTISDGSSRPCQDINRTASVSIIRNQRMARPLSQWKTLPLARPRCLMTSSKHVMAMATNLRRSPGLHSETGIAVVRRGLGPSNFVSVLRYELRRLVFRFSKKNSQTKKLSHL